ncbi:unnamed protein product [Symbiodinium natans]|uniref:Uncharacterized protein n=1 Tax=Symbiodinium natans TaxID=878477 RepID=A0A812KCI6_9DINO|nr:unnamed protein product [Symbiodinium natans]
MRASNLAKRICRACRKQAAFQRRTHDTRLLHHLGKLLSHQLPGQMDQEKRQELVKLMVSAGSEDIGTKGRLHCDELCSPETTLRLSMQDCDVIQQVRAEMHFCVGAATSSQPLHGQQLEAIMVELLHLGIKWDELKKEDREKQDAEEFVKAVRQLTQRVDYLRELENPVNGGHCQTTCSDFRLFFLILRRDV